MHSAMPVLSVCCHICRLVLRREVVCREEGIRAKIMQKRLDRIQVRTERGCPLVLCCAIIDGCHLTGHAGRGAQDE